MSPTHIIGWVALVSAAYLCFRRGAWPEKIGFLLVAANWLLTPLVERRASWAELQTGVIGANAALVFTLGLLAFRTVRVWPLAAIGFEALGVGCRLAPLINATALERAVPYADAVLGLLVMGCVVGGVIVEAGEVTSASRTITGEGAVRSGQWRRVCARGMARLNRTGPQLAPAQHQKRLETPQ